MMNLMRGTYLLSIMVGLCCCCYHTAGASLGFVPAINCGQRVMAGASRHNRCITLEDASRRTRLPLQKAGRAIYGRSGRAKVDGNVFMVAAEAASTEDGGVDVKDVGVYVRVVSPGELYWDDGEGTILKPIALLCAEVLYDAPHLHNSVAVDFLRRYGKSRTHQGIVITAFARGIPDQHYDGDMVIGCVGVETLLLTEDCKLPPTLRSAFDRDSMRKYAQEGVELRPLISNLSVNPRFRRMGVAKMLMSGCENILREDGHEITLIKVDSQNSMAMALYRGLGYAVVGEVQEERFVAGRQAEDAGVWEPALNVCLSKSLGKPYAHLF